MSSNGVMKEMHFMLPCGLIRRSNRLAYLTNQSRLDVVTALLEQGTEDVPRRANRTRVNRVRAAAAGGRA